MEYVAALDGSAAQRTEGGKNGRITLPFVVVTIATEIHQERCAWLGREELGFLRHSPRPNVRGIRRTKKAHELSQFSK